MSVLTRSVRCGRFQKSFVASLGGFALAAVAVAGPTASRPSPYPNYDVGDTATLIITTSPAQPDQPVYRWRYKNGSPDGDQPTEIGFTDENGRYQVSVPLPASSVGRYTGERFAVGSTSNPKSNSLSYRIDASNAPGAHRPSPYPNYDVGDWARLEVTTSPAQPDQPVYRWRYKNGSPDGDQPTQIGTTDGSGVLIVEGTLTIGEIGRYTSERIAVGTTTGPRSPSKSYDVHADFAPSVSRPAPYPNYFVGDFAVMNLSTSPAQPNQPVYRWRYKNGSPDGPQPTFLGNTDGAGRLTVSGTLASGEVGSYTGERFAVGTTGGPRSSSLAYTVSEPSTVAPPIVSRPSPYPDYQVGDFAVMNLSTNPVQPNATVYRWRYKDGSPDGPQPTDLGRTNASGQLTVSGTLTSDEIGSYTGERFAVGSSSNPRSAALAYTVAPAPAAPIVSRPAPFPNYRVGDFAVLNLSTNPPQPDATVYRWRYKDGVPDGPQPTDLGRTNASGQLTVSGTLTSDEIGSYTGERFAVGRTTNPRSAALAYTVAEALPPEPPTAFRPAPYPNYHVGDEAILILTTDPVQAEAPVYRFRQRNNLPDGPQPTYLGKTNADGIFEARAVLPPGSEGFYSDERFAVGSPDGPTSAPLAYNVLDPSVQLAAPTVSRDAPFPDYSVGDIARMVLTTNPIQPNQPVFRWRQKDGEDDGPQPTLIGTTNNFGRLTVEATLPAESVGSYSGEQMAVGSPDGLRSPALAYTVAPVASGEIVMSSVEPTDFDSGSLSVATVRGAGFTAGTRVEMNASVSQFVSTRVLSVSPDGTEMSVEIDARSLDPNAFGMTMLFATEGSSQKAQPVRFVKEGPVVDVWTPTVPYSGSTFVLTLLGHHLSGVSVTPTDPSVLSVRVMSTSDNRVFGLVTVRENAPEGLQTLVVSRGGKTTEVGMYVIPVNNASIESHNVFEDSALAKQAKAAGQPVPELLLQPAGISPELTSQLAELENEAAKGFGFTFSFSITWRYIYPILREAITFDVDTGQVGEIARVLGIGDQLNLGAFTFSLTGELYIHFEWLYDSSFGWFGPSICVEVLIAAEVPGATRTVSFSGCWVYGGGSGPSPGSTTMANVQGGDCAEAVTTDIIDGIGYSTVTQRDCCPQQLDLRLAGDTFGQPFDELETGVAETQPTPDCQTVPTCSELAMSIDQIDPQFAPSAERLDFYYTIWSEEFGAPTFTKMEVFKQGDNNPIFVHEPLLANVQSEPYVQDGQQGWEGKDSAGNWIHPKDGPFTVRLSASETSDYLEACTTEATFELKLHSIEVTPAGAQNLVKPNRAATEVDKQATATVKLTDKNGGGVETEIPIDLEWSFEDPDDTSARPGIDPNNAAGDDNAPKANGGKRLVTAADTSTMWKMVAGHPATLIDRDQKAEMTTQTSGNDKAKAKITFSASAVAADNYILVAKPKDAGQTTVEGKSGTWTVRKELAFSNAYEMPGGADVDIAMATANVNPAYSADGHTDYSLQGASVASPLQEFMAPLLALDPAETPTAQEVADYTAGNAAAKAAIEAKATAWYQRNRANIGPSLRAYITNHNLRTPAVIGARYYHPKMDSDPATGATNHFPNPVPPFPNGIQINTGTRTVDPDADWNGVQGVEVDNSAFVFSNISGQQRLIVVGRHEAGHASDHVSFGGGDHCPGPGLMDPVASRDQFSDKGILRLRGWTP